MKKKKMPCYNYIELFSLRKSDFFSGLSYVGELVEMRRQVQETSFGRN